MAKGASSERERDRMTTADWEIDNTVGGGFEAIKAYFGGGKEGRSKARIAIGIGASMSAATAALGWLMFQP